MPKIVTVPLVWMLAPKEGELSDSPDEVYAALQGYALGVGFAVIKEGFRAYNEELLPYASWCKDSE
jgi:hypothetical protein